MTIFIIAIGVCAAVVALYYIRLGMDKRKLEREGIRRSVEDQERQNRMRDRMDEDTKTWPILPPGAAA
jgi:hypothetical protein